MSPRDGTLGVVLATLLLGGLWWVLSNGSPSSWLVGLPALAGAAWASRRLQSFSGVRLSLIGLAGFLPFFLFQSLRGGLDVALRTLAPVMPIRPGFYRYRSALRTPAARTFFANCISLLPGTLVADLQGEWLELHVLDSATDPHRELARLERVVARLFAESELADTERADAKHPP